MEILWKRPELSDRELIDSYYKKYQSRSCERTFTNIYLWSRRYRVTFAIVENTLVFRSESNPNSFTKPTGETEDVKRALKTLRAYVKEQGGEFSLYNVTPEEFEKLEEWYPGEFEIEYERDYADYVYEAEKLATLSGKKLHSKRNHINKFKQTFENWSYEDMTKDNIEECFQMALEWRKLNGCEDDEGKNAEMCVTLNSLRLFEELELSGGLLRVDGRLVAFAMGEAINDDTFVVHIEKAFSDVQGAYPMINQQFAQRICEKYKYINREDDTGVEGLRKAKLSYRPAFLVEKGVAKEKIQ